MSKINFTLLGTGTSSGVPVIGCKCPTCTSSDPKDKRLRCSLLIESENTTIVIDTTPDFRQQMLKYDISKLDAIIYTHHHFDHIGGFDDIRALNFSMNKPIDIYLNENTLSQLSKTFNYAFEKPEQTGGGIPLINTNIINSSTFNINGLEITPIMLLHGKIEVLGFRIGDFAYLTDTNFIPENSFTLLKDLKTLVIDGLRFTHHPTHFTINESIEAIEKIRPEKAYLTHIAHQVKYQETENNLPNNIFLAYDGIKFAL